MCRAVSLHFAASSLCSASPLFFISFSLSLMPTYPQLLAHHSFSLCWLTQFAIFHLSLYVPVSAARLRHWQPSNNLFSVGNIISNQLTTSRQIIVDKLGDVIFRGVCYSQHVLTSLMTFWRRNPESNIFSSELILKCASNYGLRVGSYLILSFYVPRPLL